MTRGRRKKRNDLPNDGKTAWQRGMAYMARGIAVTTMTGLKAINFTPSPGPQESFLNTPAFETLFGGAAGGANPQP